MKLINVNNLSKSFISKDNKIDVLNNISFDLNENEILGIIGPSGCGKSTLLNLITELDKEYLGSISISNNVKFGYMMQVDALINNITNYKNSLICLKITNSINKNNLDYIDNLFKKYNLDKFKYMYPENLSGGMRQRLALIRTLSTKPNVLLLDEPFSKLDSYTRRNISDDVFKIVKDNKMSVVLITHNLEEAITMCDRLIILTNRPSSIKDIININLKGNLPSIKRKDKDYYNVYDLIWSKLNE